LSKTRAGLIAHANRAGSVYSASANFTTAGSWSVTPTGLDDAGDAITTLNDQAAFGVAGDGSRRFLYSAVLRGDSSSHGRWSDLERHQHAGACAGPNTRLSSGLALNSSQIWVGGQSGVLLSNGRSGLE